MSTTCKNVEKLSRGSVKWYNHSGKVFGNFFERKIKKLNIYLIHDPATVLQSIYPSKMTVSGCS